MSFHAERTKYPKVFKKCYWGTHFSKDAVEPEIITNRNKLKEEFQLKTFTRKLSMTILEKEKMLERL